MKVDVIIIGSGIAGLAIAAALGRQKVKALVIGPDIAESNYDFEYIFEDSVITTLPEIQAFEGIAVNSTTKNLDVNRRLLCVDSKSLYQRYLMSCADNGVGMMHGRAHKVVSYRKMHRVDWTPNRVGDAQLPTEELFAPVVIDASGGSSEFSPKPFGFSSTLRKVVRGKGDLLGDKMCYHDLSKSTDADPSFFRGFKHEDGRYFIEERRLFSQSPIPEADLEKRLLARLKEANFEIEAELSTEYFFTPLIHENCGSKILSFGDAAAFAHPLTVEGTSRAINSAPQLAKVIAESMTLSPQKIVERANDKVASIEQTQFDTKFKFIFEEVLSSSQLTCRFLEAIFESNDFFETLLLGNTLDSKTDANFEGVIRMLGSNIS